MVCKDIVRMAVLTEYPTPRSRQTRGRRPHVPSSINNVKEPTTLEGQPSLLETSSEGGASHPCWRPSVSAPRWRRSVRWGGIYGGLPEPSNPFCIFISEFFGSCPL